MCFVQRKLRISAAILCVAVEQFELSSKCFRQEDGTEQSNDSRGADPLQCPQHLVGCFLMVLWQS